MKPASKDGHLKKNRLKLKKIHVNIQTPPVSEHPFLFENVSVGDYTPVKIELVTHHPRVHEWPETESVFKCSLLLFSMHERGHTI